ncbi:MAG: carboxypeptidase-like regulatory domain-containing protein, partial [Planctomycetota bacterium]
MRRATLLLLLAAASAQEPEGRRPIIPPGDPFPLCGTGRVWVGPLRVRVVSGKGGPPVGGIDVVLSTGAEARTDKGGIARFHMAYSTDMLRIRAKGYHPFEDCVPDADEELLVELKPGVALCGRVRLADGKPAKGARAVCWDESSIREFDTPQIADGKGRFVIPAVDKAKPFRLVVSLDGFAPLEVRGVLLREGPELDLK